MKPATTTLIHVSDLHFGRTNPHAVAALLDSLNSLEFDLLVISGDLTQRSYKSQWAEAKAFLDKVRKPMLIVPGNHDVPLHNPLERFLMPTRRFRSAITPDLAPRWSDGNACVVGMSSPRAIAARPRLFTEGGLSAKQLAAMTFSLSEPAVFRVVVTHHPPLLPPRDYGTPARSLVGARRAMKAFAAAKVDLVLYGHLHLSQVEQAIDHDPSLPFTPLCVMAGSATSTRLRGEVNAFHRIRMQSLAKSETDGDGNCVIETYALGSNRFSLARTRSFRRNTGGWHSAVRE